MNQKSQCDMDKKTLLSVQIKLKDALELINSQIDPNQNIEAFQRQRIELEKGIK